MRQMFVLRVKEKEAELKETEKEVKMIRHNQYSKKQTFYFNLNSAFATVTCQIR